MSTSSAGQQLSADCNDRRPRSWPCEREFNAADFDRPLCRVFVGASVFFPQSVDADGYISQILSLAVYVAGANPVSLVLLGGLLNGVLLPAIGFSTVYFRYTRTDCRLRPSWAWDAFLILSCVGALIVGVYGIASPFLG